MPTAVRSCCSKEMADMLLPLEPEQVTSTWLTEALRLRYPGATVTNSRIVDVVNGTSTKIRLKCEYNQAGRDSELPETLIVKGGFEPHSPGLKEVYANEARFYRDVQPFVPIHSPRCYYAGIDPLSYQSVVIMEDLKASGVEFLHTQRPQRYPEVARRLTDMARYHAQTWNSAQLKPGGRFEWIGSRFSGWSRGYLDRYFEPDVWQHYITSPRGAAVSRPLHNRTEMQRALHRLGEIEATEPV